MEKNSDILIYGVTEQTQIKDATDRYVEEILCNGYTVIPTVFSAEEMHKTAALIDEYYKVQCSECGGEDVLKRAKDEDILRCPLTYDEHFLSLAAKPAIQDIIARVLGKKYVLMMQNAIINRSDKEQYQTRWHRDLNYQHWTSSKPLSLNFLIAVDEFFEAGGSTWILPGSQHYATFPSDEFMRKFQYCLEAKAGSVIMMDSMTYHRAGINQTKGFTRRGLNHVVGLPFMNQQMDIPVILKNRGKDFSGDSFLAEYLGYRWNPQASIKEWRHKHAG